MDKFLKLHPMSRKNLIQKAANDLSLRFDIIEKDLWVCYVLQKLFSHETLKNNLLFKGGTSLSKAYNVIERFSEDVDITINKDLLKIQSEKTNKIRKATHEFVKKEIFQILTKIFDYELGSDNYNLIYDETDKNNSTLLFSFPQTEHLKVKWYGSTNISDQNYNYIKSKIKLEFGARGGISPSETKIITPYAMEILPDYFNEIKVNTLSIKRTFIEKLFILHTETLKPENNRISECYSRHYYDVYSMLENNIKIDPIEDLEILKAVANNNQQHWKKLWVNYEEINKFSDIKLIPSEHVLKFIEKDYQNMKEMFFKDCPKFEKIVLRLKVFEDLLAQNHSKK